MRKKAILRTLAYADVFDYPLKENEIYRFLISKSQMSSSKFQKGLLSPSPEISEKDGFYFLRGRKGIVATRKKRERWSQEKLKIARRVAGWLKLIPSIKMVAITGALAMENSDEEDDIDLFIITSANRLWFSRGLVVTFLRLTGLYRRPGKIKNKICPNMLLDESHLKIPKKEQDLFSAHEVCQLKLLWNRNKTYQKFIKENQWVKRFLPNAFTTPRRWRLIHNTSEVKPKQSYFMTPPRWGNLEALARRAQLWYMSSRKTTEITEPGRIRFHPQDAREWVLKEYQRRLKKLRIA